MANQADKRDLPKAVDSTPEDDKISTTSSYQKLTSNLRKTEAKRRTYRRTLQQYERIKERFTETIQKLNKKEQIGDKGILASFDPEK